jgi:hypothetical protein
MSRVVARNIQSSALDNACPDNASRDDLDFSIAQISATTDPDDQRSGAADISGSFGANTARFPTACVYTRAAQYHSVISDAERT